VIHGTVVLVVALAVQGSLGEELRVGESRMGVIEPSSPTLPGRGGFVRFDLSVAPPGKVTVDLESYDFDAFLRIEDERGSSITEADGGGIETNARVAMEVQSGKRYGVVVAAAEPGGAGPFRISITEGEVPPLDRPTYLHGAAEFRAKAAERSFDRGDHRRAAHHRFLEADWRIALHQYEKAESALKECVTLAGVSKDLGLLARAKCLLGNVFSSTGRLGEARAQYEESLALARSLEDGEVQARAVRGLGDVFLAVADYPQARAHFTGYLENSRSRGDPSGMAIALANLAAIALNLAEYEDARRCAQRALELARSAKDRGSEAMALSNLGHVEFRLGSFEQAGERYREWLEIARDLSDPVREARALASLGNVHLELGEYDEAGGYYEESLAISRGVGDRVIEGSVRGNLANLSFLLGEFEDALEHYDEQLRIVQDIGDKRGEATVLGNLGSLLTSLGEYRKAEECHEQSLEIAQAIGTPDLEAAALGNLGVVARLLGETDRARDRLERQLALLGASDAPGAKADALGNLGLVDLTEGSFESAWGRLEAQRELARDRRLPAKEAFALGNLAKIKLARSEAEEARALAEASRSIREELGDEDGLVDSLETLARGALLAGDLEAAEKHVQDARRLLERSGAHSLAAAYRAGLRSRYAGWEGIQQDLVALRVARSEEPSLRAELSKGFTEAGSWKEYALFEGIVEHRRGARSAEAIRLRRERRDCEARLRQVQQRVSEAEQAGDSDRSDALREEVKSLRIKAERIRGEHARVSRREKTLDRPAEVDPDALREAVLDARTVLLEYVEGTERLYVYIVSGGGGLRFLDLGSIEDIRRAVEELLTQVSDLERLGGVREVARSGRDLYDRLLARPLEAAGEGIERLIVVPSRTLVTLPFETLVLSSPERPGSFLDLEFVLDRYGEVCYAPSSPVAVELAKQGRWREGGKALILADPLYAGEERKGEVEVADSGGSLIKMRPRRFVAPETLPRLERTRDEALAIADLLAGEEQDEILASLTRIRTSTRRSDRLFWSTFDLYLGEHASSRVLRGDLRSYAVIHVGAHGFVDPELPRDSFLAFSYVDASDPGYFRVVDALELDLDANLVILSACDTARGRVRAGVGVESLATAFLYAGARAVLATLWSAEEDAAASLMQDFYRAAIKRGRAPARALREAKLALRRKETDRGVKSTVTQRESPPAFDFGHPYFWAPFIYIGNPW
jgi:CHAT domain-containing protein/tetratricopeptide (TPR) repeat protein